MYSAWKLNKQGDNIQPWRTSFSIWNQSVVPCPVLTVASWPAYRLVAGHVVWYSHLFQSFSQFVVIHAVKGFGIVNKAEEDAFLELSCFLTIQRMLAIWSLVLLPFLNPAWTSGSSQFTYSWSLVWRILSIALLAWRRVQFCGSLSILWHCLSLGLEWKMTFSLLSFPNLPAYWVQHFHRIIFQDLK